MFHHQHAVGHTERNRSAGAALADDQRNHRHPDIEAGLDTARDGLGLTALLRPHAGVGAGRVDQRQHRHLETLREPQQPRCLAVALRVGHAEVVRDPALGIGAFLLADDHGGVAAEAPQPADDCTVLAEDAVARERQEVGDEAQNVIGAVRPQLVAGDLRLLPGGEAAVGLPEQAVDLAFEARNLVEHVDAAVVAEMAKLLELALDLRDRLLKIEVTGHRVARSSCANIPRDAPTIRTSGRRVMSRASVGILQRPIASACGIWGLTPNSQAARSSRARPACFRRGGPRYRPCAGPRGAG